MLESKDKMVGYGNALRNAKRTEWDNAYINYDNLKVYLEEIETIIKRFGLNSQHTEQISLISQEQDDYNQDDGISRPLGRLLHMFHIDLQREIEKVSLFVLARQGEIGNAVGFLSFDNTNDLESPLFDGNNRVLSSSFDYWKHNNYKDKEENELIKSLCAFSYIGVELLHLLKYICVNAMAIRKILKKHDKILMGLQEILEMTTFGLNRRGTITAQTLISNITNSKLPDDHIQHLTNSQSIIAIHASLLLALLHCEQLSSSKTWHEKIPLLRFQYVIRSIHVLRENADAMNRPFQTFLSQRAMIISSDVQDNLNLDTSASYALEMILQFNPNDILSMEDDVFMDWKRKFLIDSVSSTGMSFEGVINFEEMEEISSGRFWGGVDKSSMIINLMSTLLYTVNYYIVAPTANHYASALGTDGAFGATLVGSSSFSALFATFLYSFWYTKSTFQSALLFSAFCPLVGNLMYAIAISYQSMTMAICGRILVGFGSAEVVNRQLISTCVLFKFMTQASALFVAAGAIGMSVGPLLAGILDLMAGRDYDVDLHLSFMPEGGIIYNHVSSPGFVMAVLWLLEIIALFLSFHEPQRINTTDENLNDLSSETTHRTSNIEITKYGTGSIETEFEEDTPHANPIKRLCKVMVTELYLTSKLICSNPALPTTLILFGFIELADEILISSCSMICRRYFGWHGSTAGFLIASLGALVLPAHFVVERATHYYSDRRLIKVRVLEIYFSESFSILYLWLCFYLKLCIKYSLFGIIIGLIAIMNYDGLLYDITGLEKEAEVSSNSTVIKTKNILIGGEKVKHLLNAHGEFPYDWGIGKAVYIIFLNLVFMGTIILEGVDTSLMSKVTPSGLNERFINSGLLATLVGTLGRVIGDSTITISALLDINIFIDFVEATFFPVIFFAIGCLVLVKVHYKMLVE